jgi:hypothetical protein
LKAFERQLKDLCACTRSCWLCKVFTRFLSALKGLVKAFSVLARVCYGGPVIRR